MVKNLTFVKIQIFREKFVFSYLRCKIGTNPNNSEWLAAMIWLYYNAITKFQVCFIKIKKMPKHFLYYACKINISFIKIFYLNNLTLKHAIIIYHTNSKH